MKIIIRSPKIFLFLFITFFNSCENENEKIWQIDSPDTKIRLKVQKSKQDDTLYYSVQIKDNDTYTAFTDQSRLGIDTEKTNFYTGLEFVSRHLKKNQKISYSMISGSADKYTNEYNEIELKFKNDENRIINIVFRVFNNGVAFRYEFPENKPKNIHITKEYSSFKFNKAYVWANPYDTISQWAPGYETYIKNEIKTGTSAPENKNGWAFPMLFKKQNHWALISESNLNGSYGASHLESECRNGEYRIRFAEEKEARGFYKNSSYLETPGSTPWRFVTIGRDLSDILESHLVTDLADPNVLEDTGWIIPGRASWSWWSESDSPQDYHKLIPFIDLASEMGWEYSLVDANWNRMKNGDIEKLAKYAKNKNVGLLLWYNSGGKHNIVTEEPRDLMYNREIRLKEFERISNLGIKGIKVDFFQSDKQEIIKQYIGILEDAAKYHLLVNFHGCTLPRGWRRTYPNLLSMEAVRGAESYKYDPKYPEAAPSMITTIPFVRGVVGPTDFTPFTLTDSKYPHVTTPGFELALPVIIETGIIHFAENYRIIRKQPDFIKDLLKAFPAHWEELRYLSGYPGRDVVLARRKNNKWFIAGINGEKKEKIISLDLSGLNLSGNELTLYKDGAKDKKLRISKKKITNSKFEVKLKPFGGFIAVIE
jgi:hypothetical protein